MDEEQRTSQEPAADPAERALSEALARYVDLTAREQPVDRDEFCREYPDIASALRPQLDTLAEIDSLLAQEGSPAKGTDLPTSLSGYAILGEIGSGGMGRVFLADDAQLERKLAIKTLHARFSDNPVIRRRFLHEARAMAKVSHPGIAQIYGLGEQDGIPHIIMEYIDGRPLLEAARLLDISRRVALFREVAGAVGFLHAGGLIHRDLKPGNILVSNDLVPKVLDFGLARSVQSNRDRITLDGELIGTPAYFSPEQATAAELDVRSDVFSLGTILYELLTGRLPFPGGTLTDQLDNIISGDPPLPRRLEPKIPGDLQKICMKALEKKPEDRYATAGEMADDLDRFLAGEPVSASPASYARLMSGKIDRHVEELDGWRRDQVISDYEFDSFKKLYDRLIDREDAWIMEMRRFSLFQVSLYLGAWVLVVGAVLLVLFYYSEFSEAASLVCVSSGAGAMLALGTRCWQRSQPRVAVAYLLAFCLLLPVGLLVAMQQWGLFTALTRGSEDWELFGHSAFRLITHAQLWWALLLSLPFYVWLRRFTGASVFSLVTAVMGALLCLVTLLRLGFFVWINDDPGRIFFNLIPFAVLFFLLGLLIERLRLPADSRYFYPIAVLFMLAALSGVAAFHEPYAEWLRRAFPWTRGQVEYLFIINAGIYLFLQMVFERVPTAQMRSVAKAFRFFIPGHVLAATWILGLAATEQWQNDLTNSGFRFEARFFEVLLPILACLFVFASIPKQMKNFLATGLLFLAIGVVRLQQDLFENQAAWPIALLILGFLLMLGAAHYPSVRRFLSRFRT